LLGVFQSTIGKYVSRRQQYGRPGAAHQSETVVLLSQMPDDLLVFEFAQALDRECKVDVAKRISPVISLM